MIPNKPDESDKFHKNSLLVECQCGGFHYLEFDQWDPSDAEVQLLFVDQPTSFWGMVRSWWNHRKIYVGDAILSQSDTRAIIEKLTEFQKSYEQRRAKEASDRAARDREEASRTVSPTVPS